MKSKLFIPTMLILAVVTGMGLWWVQSTRAKAAKVEAEILKEISPDQLIEILRGQEAADPLKTESIVATPESRQAFIRGLREYLALAARARREGMADDPNFKLNLENKEKVMIAGLYAGKLEVEKGQPLVTQEQIDAFWTDTANEQQFKAEFDALAAVQRTAALGMDSAMGIAPPIAGEQLVKARRSWAKTKMISDRARADVEFMGQPVIKLRLKILEAGILSSNFLAKNWLQSIKASNDDIAAYLTAHPEYDIDKKRILAEQILNRALAGEDFAKMAKDLSEDRGSKNNGGLYADFAPGGLWPEVETATLSMKNGEVLNRLVESKDGFHILKFEKSTGKDADRKLTIRHILIQKRFEDPSTTRFVSAAPAPFKAPVEIAKSEVEKAKRQTYIDSIIATEQIRLPEDFEFEKTPKKQGE